MEELILISNEEFIPGVKEDIIDFIEEHRLHCLPAIQKKIRKSATKK